MNKVKSINYRQNDNPFVLRKYGVAVSRSLLATSALLIFILLTPSAWAEVPSSLSSDASDYEIPLGELNKVKKESPVKKKTKEHKKNKVESPTPPSADMAVPGEKVDQTPATALVVPVPGRVVPPEFQHQTISDKTVKGALIKTVTPNTSTSPITIHHDPYSYVITGKRTTIQAVISSADIIRTVYCRFRTTETGAHAFVPMMQVPGTHFTYSAILPGLAAASRSLRYNIIAIDSLGHETRSQEFVIAVKSSNVLPGWQSETSPDVIKIRLENSEKPLEGFSDQGIVE
jgi:hypothetical protein